MTMEPNRIMLEPSAAAAVVACSLSKQQQQQQLRNGEAGGGVEEEKEEVLLLEDDNGDRNDPSSLAFVNFPRTAAAAHIDSADKAEIGDEHGFRAQLDSFTKALFGSCGSVMETACRWPNHHQYGNTCSAVNGLGATHRGAAGVAAAAAAGLVGASQVMHRHQQHQQQQQQHYHSQQYPPQPLSIAEELRQIAIAEGRDPFAVPLQPRSADIPRFLGEDAVHSIDDDNISAISQHTLEDMARRGHVHHVHPMCTSNSSSNANNNIQDPSEKEDPPPSEAPSRTRPLSSSCSNNGACSNNNIDDRLRRKSNETTTATRAEC
jgi:hypothetical protein